MSRLCSLFLVFCFVAYGAAAERRTARPSPSPSISPDDERCYLTVVDSVVQACCKKTGEFVDGVTNCTNFAYNFDKLCSEAIGPENCFTVSVSCPNNPVGHRLNMVKLGDGRYYVVEPQGEVYYDFPLPSPKIPDALLCKILPGCGCSAVVAPYSKKPHTWDGCSDNDARLLGGYGGRPGPDMLNRCYSCCAAVPIPPSHPDPESFRLMCRSSCEYNFKPEPTDGEEYFSKYCSRMYSGLGCKMCCSYLEEGKKCEESCVDGIVLSGEVPKKAPEQCRMESSDDEACYDCCREQYSFCDANESIPCQGWMQLCVRACGRPRPPPTRLPSPSPIAKR
jgi:hypothetical protein